MVRRRNLGPDIFILEKQNKRFFYDPEKRHKQNRREPFIIGTDEIETVSDLISNKLDIGYWIDSRLKIGHWKSSRLKKDTSNIQ